MVNTIIERIRWWYWRRYGKKFFRTEIKRPQIPYSLDGSYVVEDCRDIAIVIQGPIRHENQFTLETIRSYRKIFPNVGLFFSTWRNEDPQLLDEIRNLDVNVITSDLPSNPGIGNINLQMVSTANGVNQVLNHDYEYILKTRSDQRFYSPKTLSLLKNMHGLFPVEIDDHLVKGRIVGVSLNSFLYRMYGLSDMMHFGFASDIQTFWNGQIDLRDNSAFTFVDQRLGAIARNNVCEVWLTSNFLRSTGWELKWSLKDSWEAFTSRFIVVDAASIDLFWPKYSSLEYRWRSYRYEPKFLEIDFATWLNMPNLLRNVDETVLDRK